MKVGHWLPLAARRKDWILGKFERVLKITLSSKKFAYKVRLESSDATCVSGPGPLPSFKNTSLIFSIIIITKIF